MYQIFLDFYYWSKVGVGVPHLTKNRMSFKDYKNPISNELASVIDKCITGARTTYKSYYPIFEHYYINGTNLKRTSKKFNLSISDTDYIIHKLELHIIGLLDAYNIDAY